jgi:hypothetical protein
MGTEPAVRSELVNNGDVARGVSGKSGLRVAVIKSVDELMDGRSHVGRRRRRPGQEHWKADEQCEYGFSQGFFLESRESAAVVTKGGMLSSFESIRKVLLRVFRSEKIFVRIATELRFVERAT